MPLTPHHFPTAPVLPDDQAMRSRLKTGDLLLCSGTSVFSELIQQATDSPWSHVALIVRLDDIGRILLFESVESQGVRAVTLLRYLTDYDQQGRAYPGGLAVVRHRTLARDCSAQDIERMLQFAVDQFGSAYNRQQIVRIAGRLLGHAMEPAASRPKAAQPREFICSEYVAACFAQAGVELQPRTHDLVTPGDFADPEWVELVGVLQPPP